MGFVRRHPIVTAVVLVGALLLAVLGVTATAVWRLAHTDEARRVSSVDVIAVLGAAQYNGTPSPVFEGRLAHAELLYQEKFAPRVLVLGGGQAGDETTEADAGRDWLISEGLPDDAVVAEPQGGTTLQSLEAAARWMRSNGFHSVFLVSDPWHNLRIRTMARDLGLQAYVSATFHSAAKSQWTRLAGYSRETFAYLYYRAFGH